MKSKKKTLKTRIRRKLLKIKRIAYPFFHNTHLIFRDKNYFLNLFLEKAKYYNIRAIDFSEGLITGNFKGRSYLMNFRPGDLIETHIYIDGHWEKSLAELMSQVLSRSSGIMLDIGANIGASTIPLAICYNNIEFYCYDPHPEIFRRLKSNIKLNRLDNVHAVNCAISNSKKESLTFYAQIESSNMGLSSLKLNSDIEKYDKITTPVKSIDELFKKSSESVSVIKIDTQGSELEVLKSGEQIIKRDRPVIFFEFEDEYYSDKDRDESKRFLVNFFKEMNYSLFNITKDFNYYPKIDITQKYNGDILAMPN